MEEKATIIAVAGKGGVGKTSLSATIVRCLVEKYPDKKILAIDADPAVGLSTALGIDVKLTIDDIRKEIIASVDEGDTRTAIELLGEAKYRIFDALVEVIKAPINLLIDGLNVFIRGLNKIKIPDWVPKVGGKGLHFNEISKLAEGGVLKRGQVGILEGSGAEAVVPLEKNRQWIARVVEEFKKQIDLSNMKVNVNINPGASGSMGGQTQSRTTNMTFNQYNNSPKALDRLSIYRETNSLLFAAKVRMSNV